MIKTFIFSLIGLSLISPWAISDSMAADNKVYPGNMCKPDWSSRNNYYYVNDSMFSNNTDQDIWVNCPVIKDIASSYLPTSAKVRVGGSNWSGTLTCSLRSHTMWGSVSFSSSDSLSRERYEELYMVVPIGVSEGYFSIRCYLPRNTTIFSYSITEN